MQIFNYIVLISFARLIFLLDKETLHLLADNPRVCVIIINVSVILGINTPNLEYEMFAVITQMSCFYFYCDWWSGVEH